MKNHHGAQESGEKGESNLKTACRMADLELLVTRKDFKGTEYNKFYYQTRKLLAPQEWIEDVGHDFSFLTDGFIPQLDCKVEFKYGEAKGTTEEKVFYDLEKIRDGVYDNDFGTLYIFMGTVRNSICTKVFKRKVLKEKLKVKVLQVTNIEELVQELAKMKNADGNGCCSRWSL
jgi:hypothetical protein